MRPVSWYKPTEYVKRTRRTWLLPLALLSAGSLVFAGSQAAMAEAEVAMGTKSNIETYEGDKDGRHRTCIYVPGINGFNVIDNKHLTVSTGPRRVYLVTLWNSCQGLRWAEAIAIKSFSSWTCSNSRDTILIENDRCIIDNIERVDSVKQAKSLVAERKESAKADTTD